MQDAQPVPKDETGQPGQFSDWQPMNAEVENIAYLASWILKTQQTAYKL